MIDAGLAATNASQNPNSTSWEAIHPDQEFYFYWHQLPSLTFLTAAISVLLKWYACLA